MDDIKGALARGDDAAALRLALKVLAKSPEHAEAARTVSSITRRVHLPPSKDMSKQGLINALAAKDVDRPMIIVFAIRFLVATTRLGQLMQEGRNNGWQAAAKRLLTQPSGLAICRDPLFLKCLQADICTSPDVEHLTTAARRHLLLDPAYAKPPKGPAARLLVPLLDQVAATDYVHYVDDTEQAELSAVVLPTETGDLETPQGCWAMYKRLLYGLDALPTACPDKLPLPGLADWIRERGAEIAEEQRIAGALPTIGKKENEVSNHVAAFYETSPYPKWRSLHLTTPGSRRRYLATFADPELTNFMNNPFDVWIAGAGTGQQVLDAAAGYGPGASLTATDLSRASLAYASRSLDQFGYGGVTFAQSDILDAPSLEKQFDVIESVGVLHHMEKPFDGWRALTQQLRPGGLMRIGLYSRAARRAIEQLRERFKEQGLTGTPEEIRTARQELFRSTEPAHASLTGSQDFYALWNVRDLLFHVQEHTFTIPEIETFLDEVGLQFLGFECPPWLDSLFQRETRPGTPKTDLAAWHEVEQRHTEAFQGMYVFWCRFE